MKILIDDAWVDGFTDEHRAVGQLRIRVAVHQAGERLRTLYFEQPRDPRRVWNYVREVGPMAVARKVASRRRESVRNEKYVGVGIGEVLECDPGARFAVGDLVIYVAPAQPRCQERIVLDAGLCRTVGHEGLGPALSGRPEGPPTVLDWEDTGLEVPSTLRGWSPHSGVPLDADGAAEFLERYEIVLATAVAGVQWPTAAGWQPSRVSEVRMPSGAPDGRLRATVMGLGHYAKISLIPNLDERLVVTRVHEVDPTQSGPDAHPFVVDSSPSIRDDADVFFLAGFHHTHAPLAADALSRGASAVIEKPVATTVDDLETLLAAMDANRGSVHVGFHKRYQPFNDWAREDLGAERGDPINYYAIAYEVPLPTHHWYRWPRSGSRLLSNGCHWVDHFLFLNEWSRPRSLDVARFPGGDMSVRIVLDNDAAFHMVLTDQGGARIGVQDHVELRRGNRTVRIRNGHSYESEDDRRILRRQTENKTIAYRRMYEKISSDLVNGVGGDSRRSVDVTGRAVLELEALAREAAAGGPATRVFREGLPDTNPADL